jgi:hypothetical protein
LHGFIVTADGRWVVVQQGMNDETGMARRYHWHSAGLASFVNSPHTGIAGPFQGEILNLVDAEAGPAQEAIMEILRQPPEKNLKEIGKLVMDRRHSVGKHCVDLKRLGAVLATAYERTLSDFAAALLVEKLGPWTLQSLALVAEVIHGAAARFRDPARFAFAHGGKDGHPFPVPTRVYDRTVEVLQTALENAKLGDRERSDGMARLHRFVLKVERELKPRANFDELLAHEKRISHLHGGRTVFGPARKPPALGQRTLFE